MVGRSVSATSKATQRIIFNGNRYEPLDKN